MIACFLWYKFDCHYLFIPTLFILFLQGAFLFVFFFLLNEEVRSVIKNKDIKKQLGWDVSTGNIGAAASADDQAEDTIPLNPTIAERVSMIIIFTLSAANLWLTLESFSQLQEYQK